jgi:hypothetical protein
MNKLDGADARIFPVGLLLRATGLDELPQLINVILGDMSLVGPRPCVRYEYERFRPEHCARFDAVPGLTGLWQVSGKNNTTFQEMIDLDIAYARHITRCNGAMESWSDGQTDATQHSTTPPLHHSGIPLSAFRFPLFLDLYILGKTLPVLFEQTRQVARRRTGKRAHTRANNSRGPLQPGVDTLFRPSPPILPPHPEGQL